MTRRGETAGVAREEGTGAPPSCSVVQEASEAACNPHAASSVPLSPSRSMTAWCAIHMLRRQFFFFFSLSFDDAACNPHAA